MSRTIRSQINDNKLPCPHDNCQPKVSFFEKLRGLESHYRQVHQGEYNSLVTQHAQKICDQLLLQELCEEFCNLERQKHMVCIYIYFFYHIVINS